MSLLNELIENEWLKTDRVIDAFEKIKRKDFIAKEQEDLAEVNEALSIGFGQTISQPLVVAFMLELLQVKPKEKILDIGCGSGWTSALLAHIVSNGTSQEKSKQGSVIAIEIIPELAKIAKNNISKYNFIKKGIVKVICANGRKGYKKQAPFDKILASASGSQLPLSWKKQLRIGGRIVAPIKNSIWLFTKITESKFSQIEYPGFVFVPLIF